MIKHVWNLAAAALIPMWVTLYHIRVNKIKTRLWTVSRMPENNKPLCGESGRKWENHNITIARPYAGGEESYLQSESISNTLFPLYIPPVLWLQPNNSQSASISFLLYRFSRILFFYIYLHLWHVIMIVVGPLIFWRNYIYYLDVSLGYLGVTCSPRDPRFAGSNPSEVNRFFQDVKILSTSSSGATSSWGSRVWDFRLVKEPQAWKNRPLRKT